MRPACWLIVGGYPLTTQDRGLYNFFSSLCATLLIVVQAELAHLGHRHIAVGILSPSAEGISSLALPLMSLGRSSMRTLHLASDVASVHACGAVELLLDTEHPLSAGLSAGHVPVSGKPATLLSARSCSREAIKIARLSEAYEAPANSFSMLAFEPGAALCDGRRAITRYVAFGLWSDALVDDAPARATAQARALLRAALYWLAGTAPVADDGAVRAASSWASQVAEFRAYAHARTSLAKAMQRERRVRLRASGLLGLRGGVDDDDDDVLPPAVRASVRTSDDAGGCTNEEGRLTAGRSCARPDDRVSVLLHTCDAYARFWAGWSRRYQRHWPGADLCWPLHFANEVVAVQTQILRTCDGVTPTHLPTGAGEFSSRLRHALLALHTPLVLYLQEDMWLTRAQRHVAIAAHVPRTRGHRPVEAEEEEEEVVVEEEEVEEEVVEEEVRASEESRRSPTLPVQVDVVMSSLLRCAQELIENDVFDGIRFEGAAMVRAGLYHLEATNYSCGDERDARRPPLPIYRMASRTNRWLFSHQPGLWNRRRLLFDAGGHGADDGGASYGGAAAADVHESTADDTQGPVVRAGEDPWLNELMGSLRAQRLGLRVGLVVVEWFRAVSSGGVLNEEGRELVVEEIQSEMNRGVTKYERGRTTRLNES